MSAKTRRSIHQAPARTDRPRVRKRPRTLELDGLSSDSLYAAIDKAAWIAMCEGWHDWRLADRGRVVATGDEQGPR